MSISVKSKIEQVDNFTTAISTYYKLKGQYQSKNNKVVREIYNDSDLSIAQKKDKYNKLKKKCINCGKFGGTIFEETNTMLVAKCGHVESPCKLDIKLERAKYNDIVGSLATSSNLINEYKNKIIDTKLDYLFGFTNQESTLAKFEELKNNLVKIVKNYQILKDKYTSTIFNSNNLFKINALNSQLEVNINTFKENIENFKESGEISYVKDAVELYINTIKIISKELTDSKYQLKEVIKSKDSDVINLVQKSYILSDLLVQDPDTENKVISFST